MRYFFVLENYMEKKNLTHTFVNIKDGKTAVMDGIINIERFDEKGVSLLSEAGKIEIEGDELKIESLTKEDGVITVNGRIDGVFYSKEKAAVGFFKRFFG